MNTFNYILTAFVIAFLFGVINQFLLNNAVSNWVANNAEQYWFWSVWIVVFLIYLIGDKILKAMTDLSFLSDIKKELVDANERLLEIQQEIKNSHTTQD